MYDKETIFKWLKTFYWRFFAQQFKRSCLPDGPKVGSVAVSPRGDLRMPSDASAGVCWSSLKYGYLESHSGVEDFIRVILHGEARTISCSPLFSVLFQLHSKESWKYTSDLRNIGCFPATGRYRSGWPVIPEPVP